LRLENEPEIALLKNRTAPSCRARWVAAARDALVQHLRDEVAARLAIPVEDVDSVIRVVRSRIDISLERIL
jgi:RNA polymerase sigma-70 factor (ECF subfamily)